MEDPLALVDEWPVRTVAVGVLAPDGSVHTRGPVERSFPLASVTKPLFALSVLVAVEEASLALDQPAGPPGSTVRHLLAHASGLSFEGPDRIAPVGRRRIYSNAGFEVLGTTLEQSTGMATAVYLHEALVQPLGLGSTALEGSPAYAGRSSVLDLLAVAAEVLAPTLLAPETITEGCSEQFPGLAGVMPGFGRQDPNPWGLGLELRGRKSPHWTGSANSPATVGHFGRAGTCWWVDPQWGGALAVLTDRPFDTWAAQRWPVLSDAVLAAFD